MQETLVQFLGREDPLERYRLPTPVFLGDLFPSDLSGLYFLQCGLYFLQCDKMWMKDYISYNVILSLTWVLSDKEELIDIM